MTNSKALIGRRAISDFLRISHNTFYKLVDEGLPVVKRGGSWTAHTDDLEAWFRKPPPAKKEEKGPRMRRGGIGG